MGVLDVIVTDDRGRSVPDLAKSDFEVTDDGERRDIVSVSFVSIPVIPPHASPSPASDVFTNSTDLAAHRVFAIVLDDLDTSPQDTARTRAAVKTVVERLPDGDLVAVVHTGEQAGAQEFTSDKSRVLDSLNRFVGRRPLPLDDTDNIPPSERRFPDQDTQRERSQNLSRVLDTLQNVATWLAPIEGRRKAVLYVTAGLPSSLAHAFSDPRMSSSGFRDLVARATRANVAIYPVDTRGLAAPDDTDSTFEGLRSLANETGGIATVNANDIGRAVDVAVRDSSTYYMVGYALPPGRAGRKTESRLRRVRIRALRPGLTARARPWAAGGPELRPERTTMVTLIASPLAGGHIPVALHAASFAAPRGKARALVTLEVGGQAIAFSQRSGKVAASLQYRIVASDVTGRVAASESKTLEFHVSAARRDQIKDSRTRLVASLDLAPGSYRIRAAVLDAGNGEHGVVAGDLDVPRYDRDLSMSTVEIASAVEAHIPTMPANMSVFETRLGGPPTTVRTFGRGDTLDAYAEAYTTDTADHLRATATLSRENGGLIHERPLTIAREKGIGDVPSYAFKTRVPLTALAPASYRLTIAVRTSGVSVERSVSFDVK